MKETNTLKDTNYQSYQKKRKRKEKLTNKETHKYFHRTSKNLNLHLKAFPQRGAQDQMAGYTDKHDPTLRKK